jgi:hypothetical protein
VTLENLMNLLQDMGLKEEYQNVLEHLDTLEKQIVQTHKDDQERMEALNRALHGQAVAEQERRQLAQQRLQQQLQASAGPSAPQLTSTGSGNDLLSAQDAQQSGAEMRRAHPFAPQVVIVGGGAELSDDDIEPQSPHAGDNADVLLSFQAQEAALHDEQQDSFFNFSFQRSASGNRLAEDEWCRTNNSHLVGRAGGVQDDAQVRCGDVCRSCSFEWLSVAVSRKK